MGNSLLSGSWNSERTVLFPENIQGFQNNTAPETWRSQNDQGDLLNIKFTHLVNQDTIFEAQYKQMWKRNIMTIPTTLTSQSAIGTKVHSWYSGDSSRVKASEGPEYVGRFTLISRTSARWRVAHTISRQASFWIGPTATGRLATPVGKTSCKQLLFGAAYRVRLDNLPLTSQARNIDTYSVFAQDQWTIGDRLTLNLGLRWEISEAWLPEQSRGGGRWFPVSTIPETRDLINFNNLSPRLGLVYALGEARRTSIKFSFSRYYHSLITQDHMVAVPEIGGSETYEWNDLNGDLVFQDGEQGRLISRILNPRC